MSRKPITITREDLKRAILKVRDEGSTNMLDMRAVADICRLNGDRAVCAWLCDVKKNGAVYATLILRSDPTVLPERVRVLV